MVTRPHTTITWSMWGKAGQTMSKPRVTVRKVQLCVWWDWKWIIYYELLPYSQRLFGSIKPFKIRAWPKAVRIAQQERCYVSSGQLQAKLVYSDSPETPEAWSRRFFFYITTIQSRPDTKRLSFSFALQKEIGIKKIYYKSFSLIETKTSTRETLWNYF